MAPAPDPRIERYLDRACATLRGTKDAARAREELRHHAMMLSEEAMRSGVTPERAIGVALQALGEPAMLARAFRESYDLPGLVPAPIGYAQRQARRHDHRVRRLLAPAALLALAVQIQIVTFLYIWPG